MEKQYKRVWKNTLLLSLGMIAAIALLMVVFGLTDSDPDALPVLLMIGLAMGLLYAVILIVIVAIKTSNVKKRIVTLQQQYGYELAAEFDNGHFVEGSKTFYITPHWLVIMTAFGTMVYYKDEIESIDLNQTGNVTPSILVKNKAGKKKALVVNSKEPGSVKRQLQLWLNPELVDTINQDAEAEQQRQAETEKVAGIKGIGFKQLALMLAIFVAAAGLGITVFSIYRNAHPVDTIADPSDALLVKVMNTNETLLSISDDESAVKPYLTYLKDTSGDIEKIGVGMSESSKSGYYYFTTYNDEQYFWSGRIDMLANNNTILSEYYFLVPPYGYNSNLDSPETIPDTWKIFQGKFVRFTLNEPSYDYQAVSCYDDNYDYFCYATKAGNINLDNFKALAKRQYGINVIQGYDYQLMIYDSDKYALTDSDNNVICDPETASMKAIIDTSAKTIILYQNNNDGTFKEVETLDMTKENIK